MARPSQPAAGGACRVAAPPHEERRGRGDLRRVESTLLVLAFLLLAVATVNDLVREIHVNERLTVDLRSGVRSPATT